MSSRSALCHFKHTYVISSEARNPSRERSEKSLLCQGKISRPLRGIEMTKEGAATKG